MGLKKLVAHTQRDSGASLITRFDADRVATKYACEVPIGDGSDGTFNADDWMEPKEEEK